MLDSSLSRPDMVLADAGICACHCTHATSQRIGQTAVTKIIMPLFDHPSDAVLSESLRIFSQGGGVSGVFHMIGFSLVAH